jgi:uncharacterized membrane protein (UPF0127 family)
METINLKIDTDELCLEIAKTIGQQEKGLSGRKFLENNKGMIFICDPPRKVHFWMKNILIPLDLALLNSDGVILEIYQLNPFSEDIIPSKSANISYAIEVNRNWFNMKNIKEGYQIKILENLKEKIN